jgi:arylsulfatase A-like enzyme
MTSRLSTLLGLWLIAATLNAATRPNIVVILADDQGWGDLSANGNTNIATPNVDSLAKTGAMFDRFYVCPVCSPTRAEFLTGRYHPRGGVWNVSLGGERLNLDEKTIADTFKAAGYATGAFGKWHNGTQYPYHPNGRGFDEYYGFTSGHWGSYFEPPLDHNGELVKGNGYIIDDLAEHAMKFIESNKEKPFFCYIPFNTPHSPMQVPDSFYAKFAHDDIKLRGAEKSPADLAFTRAALAMCENIDWNVGRILKKLDDLKLADDTIILYFSDNGPVGPRWNGGMKGRKASTDEGGVRAPFVIRWPGHIPAGTRVPQIAGAIDLLPTLTELAGVPTISTKPLDGVSLKPLLIDDRKAARKAWPDRMIFSHWAKKVSVRTQQHRLDADEHLYDMQADPSQTTDISAQNGEVRKKLSQAVKEWKEVMLPGLREDLRPYTVGYHQFPNTMLPARDGVPHGHVQRSAKAPNCSYFREWTSLDDRITWDIEVATSGKYEATIYYTCPRSDVGSSFELSFNGSHLEGQVTEANDPPALGAENDRAPRESESLVKDFKPLPIGVVDLKSGHGELALRALNITGKQVMEVRMVTLKLLN